jgi:hypothetical protein
MKWNDVEESDCASLSGFLVETQSQDARNKIGYSECNVSVAFNELRKQRNGRKIAVHVFRQALLYLELELAHLRLGEHELRAHDVVSAHGVCRDGVAGLRTVHGVVMWGYNPGFARPD